MSELTTFSEERKNKEMKFWRKKRNKVLEDITKEFEEKKE